MIGRKGDALLDFFLEDLTLEIVFEVHRKLMSGKLCLQCDSVGTDLGQSDGVDVFGHSVNLTPSSEVFQCTNCKQRVASNRFAPHLEKCMGRGGRGSRARQAAVVASALLGNVEDDDPRDDDAFFPKKVYEKKRKTE